MDLNSIYDFKKDFSFRNEQFYIIPLSWRVHRNLVKIRVSEWKPKEDRSCQSIFYFDVKTESEAYEILEKIKSYNFKKIQNYFEKIYLRDNPHWSTGAMDNWLNNTVQPELKNKFQIIN